MINNNELCKWAEEEKATFEGQLQQVLKMESVSRLTAGVAHDFNNMLGVILGNVEMALGQVDPGAPLYTDLTEIRQAAEHSADLTRQLLLFARNRAPVPIVLNLNASVTGMLKMLNRFVGENVDLVWKPETDVWPVKTDSSQIDQVLVNLCVNARDAIADIGKITIQTKNIVVDEAYCAKHPGASPGEYVQLTVSDADNGTDKAALTHHSEPFFTTKGAGKGTGLGLTTVYSILKQNNGFVDVLGTPGQGTTFKIHLPRYVGKDEHTPSTGAAAPPLRGKETLLLVEDDPAFLRMTARMLKSQGYTVLAASTPGEAILLAWEHSDKIQLLLSDVIMPEMNGRDLTKKLVALYPHIKCLFMSGYRANAIVSRGMTSESGKPSHFIQKPFTLTELSARVREALHQK
jgi:nitrogen-specific signal transduction histidine kinase/CheY-like chemotaxis protein